MIVPQVALWEIKISLTVITNKILVIILIIIKCLMNRDEPSGRIICYPLRKIHINDYYFYILKCNSFSILTNKNEFWTNL